jgi:hypothetical protein
VIATVVLLVGIGAAIRPGESTAAELPASRPSNLYVSDDALYPVYLPALDNAPTPVALVAGQAGGSIQAMAISDGLLYTARETRLAIFDISSGPLPELIGAMAQLPKRVASVTVWDDVAYIISDALYAVDVSDPREPIVRRAFQLVRGAGKLLRRDSIAFLADDHSVVALDTTDPMNPVEIGRYTHVRPASIVGLVGDDLYVSSGGDLISLDVSEPRNMRFGEYVVPYFDCSNPQPYEGCLDLGSVGSLTVRDDFLILSRRSPYRIEVWDRRMNGSAPVAQTAYCTEGHSPTMVFDGDTATTLCRPFSGGSGLLLTFDLSRPAAPQLKAQTPVDDSDLLALGQDFGASVSSRGMTVFRMSRNESPQVTGRLPLFSLGMLGAATRTHLLVHDGHGLWVAPLDEPLNLTPALGTTIQAADAMITHGELLLTVSKISASQDFPRAPHVQVFDIADPFAPTLLGQLTIPGWDPQAVSVHAGIVIVSSFARISLVSIEDPSAPRLLGEVETGTWTGNAVVVDDYLLVADSADSVSGVPDRGGLVVIDASVPTAPRHVGYFGPSRGTSLSLRGSTVYLGTRREIAALDVSDPSQPRLVDSIEAYSQRLASADGILLSLGRDFEVFDVTRTELSRLGSLGLPDYPRDVVVFGDECVVLGGGAGIIHLELAPADGRLIAEDTTGTHEVAYDDLVPMDD